MKKHFYSHLVETTTVEQELDELNFSDAQKKDLLHHVHSSIHYTILDVVLSELPEEHKKTFVHMVREDDQERIWEHIKNNTIEIEEKIKAGIKTLTNEFIEEIKKVKSSD